MEDLSTDHSRDYLSGKKFYEQRCEICHGTDGKLGASSAKDLSKSALNSGEMEELIKNGKGAMPAFEHSIESDSTLYELIEHLTSLRK